MSARNRENQRQTKRRKEGRGVSIFPSPCHRRSFPREKKGRVDRRERKDDEEQTYKLVHPAVVAAC